MIELLLVAAQRLAEALRAENAALAELDLQSAGELAEAKRHASEAFAAAFEAARKGGARAEGELRARAEAMAADIRDLSAENRRLLERAIELQSRVIETLAVAARPATPPTYGSRGALRSGRSTPFAVSSRA
jgi:flagellar biosynthesis/type III secretory pathway chaperone